MHIDPKTPRTSRRQLILNMALSAGAIGVIAASLAAGRGAAATPKLPQKDIGYQNTPKGAQRCDKCVNWQGPSSCKVVAGVINPAGWCGIFAPKP